MKEGSNLDLLLSANLSNTEILPTLFSFVACVVMSFIVRDLYIRRSFSLTGKMHIGSIIPVLSSVVFLVIVIVKSSLALSLGLVGALSIVRFRTPIKEPEELVYLFLAIAIGLGYASGQVLITTILTTAILLVIYIWLSNRKILKTNEYNLVVKWSKKSVLFDDIMDKIKPFALGLKLIRLDKSSSGNTSVMLISPNPDESVESVIENILKLDKDINVTFFEAKTNW